LSAPAQRGPGICEICGLYLSRGGVADWLKHLATLKCRQAAYNQSQARLAEQRRKSTAAAEKSGGDPGSAAADGQESNESAEGNGQKGDLCHWPTDILIMLVATYGAEVAFP
jgi:hypothetical protein